MCGSQEPKTNTVQCEPIEQTRIPHDEESLRNHELENDNFQICASLENSKSKNNMKKAYLPIQTWYERISKFIEVHVEQLETYSQTEIKVVEERLIRYLRNDSLYIVNDITLESIAILEMAFKSQNNITLYLKTQASQYALNNKREEFEQIMLNFSMIVNSPRFERPYN